MPPAHVAGGTTLAAGSRVGPLAVIGAGCVVGEGAEIVESVVQDGVTIGAQRAGRAQRRGQRRLGRRRTATSCNAVIGDGCRIGADNVIANGCCLFPGTVLADGAVKFREFDGVEGR